MPYPYKARLLDEEETLFPRPEDYPVPVAPPVAPTPPPPPPKPWERDPDEETLRLAYDYALKQQDRAQGSRNRASFVAGITPGGRPDYGAAEGLEAAGKIPLEQAKTGIAMRERGEEKEAKAAKTREKRDPASPTSRLARSLLKKASPALAAEMGATLEQMNASQIEDNFPFMKEFIEAESRTAAAQAKATTDAAETERKRTEKLEDYERNRGDRLHDMGYQRNTTLEAARIAAGTKADTKASEDTKDLMKAIPPGASGFYEQRDNIRRIIAENGGDIPGVGPVAGRLPTLLLSNKGKELQKYARQMQLAYRNLVTGTGGGQKEMEEISRAGADLENEEGFMRGLEALEKGYDARLRQVFGGFRPEVVETYLQRVPEFRPRGSGPVAPSGTTKKVGGKTYYKAPDGSWEVDE